MRVDRVKHREYSIRNFQLMVNDMVKKGLTKEGIEQALDKLQIKLVESNTGEEINLIPPKVLLEPSHLNKGYIAFFKCPNCLRKVRTLYYIRGLLACRISHGLTYKKQDKRQVLMNKLIAYDNFREAYLKSMRPSSVRMAMEAEWARETIMEKGQELGEEIIKRYYASK